MREKIEITQRHCRENNFIFIYDLYGRCDWSIKELDDTFSRRKSDGCETSDKYKEPYNPTNDALLKDVSESIQRKFL